ncbi:MAG: metallophosphoesterase [Geminicoccaceae bacterium]
MTLHAFQSAWETAPRPAPAGAMLLAVGDVHGHLDHLDALVGLLRPEIARAASERCHTELVLIGDYVDRGPSSLGVLRRIADLPYLLGVPVHALRGNHDHYLIDFMLADEPDPEALEAWCGNGGESTLAELGIGAADIERRDPLELAVRARDAAGPRVLSVLRHLEPYRRIGDYFFVHAGVHPLKPLAEHTLRDLLWLREPFLSARQWHQPFVVVHGHTIRGPEVFPHRIAIDSGAYRTGVLTAVQIQGNQLRFWCVTSDAKLKAFRRLEAAAQRRRFTAPTPLPG